jgi:integrase
MMRHAAEVKANLVDPFEDQKARTLVQHLEDYHDHLVAKDNSPPYCKKALLNLTLMFDACSFRVWDDLNAAAVSRRLGVLKDKNTSPRRRNELLKAMQTFCTWMVNCGRAASSPLSVLATVNEEKDRRVQRRALERDDIAHLLKTVRGAAPRCRLTGIDRAMLYVMAMETGFRVKEIRSLTPESFDLNDFAPCITVEAAHSKRGRRDEQPIRKELAADLAVFLEARPASEPVFVLPDNCARMLRLDLELAGLPYKDDAGRVFDFHALRGQFITGLVRSGASPKQAQILARHSTITLTMDRYTHISVREASAALERV